MITNCEETFISQKANQWKRNNLVIKFVKWSDVIIHVLCSDNQQNLRSQYLIGLIVPVHLLRLLADNFLLCQPSPDVECFIAIA